MAGNKTLNSPANTNLPHGVSMWFQKDFAGDYQELGDLLVDEVTAAPEFLEHFSYRNGLRALRKRILTQKAASITATLNEPSILNFQRILFGGTISDGNSFTEEEGRQAELKTGTDDELYIDIAEMDSDVTVANVTVIAVYELDDALEQFGMAVQGSGVPDGNNRVEVQNTTETTASDGDTVYVRYQIAQTNMFKTEIFGASEATIEGAMKLQARNQSGGVEQAWDIASVQLSPNGGIPFALDAIQTLPLLATLQERGGTFGTFYSK